MPEHTKSEFDPIKLKINGFIQYEWKITDHLAVAYSRNHDYSHYKVYILQTGKALTGKIKSFNDAVMIAKAFAWIYRDQIWLYEYEDWAYRNIPELARWTIEHGHAWMKVWNYLAETKNVITVNTLKSAYYHAQKVTA